MPLHAAGDFPGLFAGYDASDLPNGALLKAQNLRLWERGTLQLRQGLADSGITDGSDGLLWMESFRGVNGKLNLIWMTDAGTIQAVQDIDPEW